MHHKCVRLSGKKIPTQILECSHVTASSYLMVPGAAIASLFHASQLRSPISDMLNVQFLSFAIIGASGTAVHYFVLGTLVLCGLASPGIAAAIGACFGACVNYWLNHRYTFASTRQHRETLPRFFLMALVGAAVNGIIVNQLSSFGMNFLVAQFASTCFILISNFLISKKWIFQKAK